MANVRFPWATTIVLSLFVSTNLQGQDGRFRSEGRQRIEGDVGSILRILPLMIALDTDQNSELSADEVANAAKAISVLDKNHDGKITTEEMRPVFNARGPTGVGPGVGSGGESGQSVQVEATALVENLMNNDKNGDEKLSVEEVSERMRPIVERADANKDGFATKDELLASAIQQNSRVGGRMEGRGPGREGFAGPNPEEFVERLFQLDSDKDEKLSREELSKGAANLFGRPGRREEERSERDRN